MKPTTLEGFKNLLKDSEFVIFGTGKAAVRLWGVLGKLGLSPVAFLDNYIYGIEKNSGLPIFKPTEYNWGNKRTLVLLSIVTDSKSDEVFKQLINQGISEDLMMTLEEVAQALISVDITWQNTDENTFDWSRNNHRIEEMAKMIGGNITSVADLGCGNQHLKSLLSSSFKYVPIDYISRSEDTVVLDFNNDILPQISVDCMFLSGIISYIEDLPNFFDWVCTGAAKQIVIGHRYPYSAAKEKFFSMTASPSFDEVKDFVCNRGFLLVNTKNITQNNLEYAIMSFERI
ncbi:MAG: hypothetical protein FWE33_04235 [Defluviitaleaceae bacterium]|nr:hypothetical protein [Defluviitaleaceae bacterium]